MTDAERWRTLAKVLGVTAPLGALIGSGLEMHGCRGNAKGPIHAVWRDGPR